MNPRYEKPALCSGCSLERAGYGFVPGVGPQPAMLNFMGESAGYEEAIKGEPFYGAAGGMLSRLLQRAGINRQQARIFNAIACRPPGDFLVGASYEEHAISCCAAHRNPEYARIPDNGVLVTLGATPTLTTLNLRGVAGVQMKDLHGTVWRDPSDRYFVVPTFHPAHLLRGAMSLTEVVTQDLALALKISRQGFTRKPTNLIVDPMYAWFDAWVADHLAKVAQDPSGVHLSIDTEFAEKAGGADESEVVLADTPSPITRVNGGNDDTTGWTVPYREPFISRIRQLLTGTTESGGLIWMWNKYADLSHLWADRHVIPNEMVIDGMWLAHFLQSDLPRGLGFWAPMASDFGAWKHWGKDPQREGVYAAADGVQNWRTCMWLLKAAQQQGIWDLFLDDWHERDVYVLRPAHEQGTPVNRERLQTFHEELQEKLANVLLRIKTTAAQGVLKPKQGYATCPLPKVPAWFKQCLKGEGRGKNKISHDTKIVQGATALELTFRCDTCSRFEHGAVVPPASILGKPKKGGGEAKQQYMLDGIQLVEKEIDLDIQICETCGAEDVGAKHRCALPKAPEPRSRNRPSRRKKRVDDADVVGANRQALLGAGGVQDAAVTDDPATGESGASTQSLDAGSSRDAQRAQRPAARLVTQRARCRRYFWQLPFNPDAPQQVLAYLADRGIEAPVDKKRGSKTTNKKALKELQKQYSEDPFFQLQLDWKAVQKVDSTYAVGALARLDKDDRLHPEFLPKPSTFRDSCVGVNLQNVVADKAGPDGLASGFRRCVESRDGVPENRTAEELAAWALKWDR